MGGGRTPNKLYSDISTSPLLSNKFGFTFSQKTDIPEKNRKLSASTMDLGGAEAK